MVDWNVRLRRSGPTQVNGSLVDWNVRLNAVYFRGTPRKTPFSQQKHDFLHDNCFCVHAYNVSLLDAHGK